MPARSYAARHRSSTSATATPRRLAGLVLPAAAAAALTFTATGAAMATDQYSAQAVSFRQNTSQVHQARVQAEAAARDQQELSVRRTQSAEDRSALAFRTQAAERAARDTQRKALAVRAAKALAAKKAKALAASGKTWQLPLRRYVLTSEFGPRWGRLHAGNDFSVPVGTPLMAMSSGQVIFAGSQGGYGNKVEIRYWDGTVSYYAHMNGTSVKKGDKVTKGQVVGASGNTGHSTGPHLHLEIHPRGGAPVNPIPWLSAHGIKP